MLSKYVHAYFIFLELMKILELSNTPYDIFDFSFPQEYFYMNESQSQNYHEILFSWVGFFARERCQLWPPNALDVCDD